MPMARVNSGSVAPSYPRAQNTSRARSSASSTSNCRLRPEGMTIPLYRSVKKMLSALAGASPAAYTFIVPNGTRNSREEITMARSTQERPLAGKVALVTGGSRGIGAAIARRLAADGASVAVTYSKGADAAAALVKDIERGGGKALAIQADATDPDAVKAAVEKTVAAFDRLDVLVNNAGTAIPKPFEEATLEEMDRVLDVNVR